MKNNQPNWIQELQNLETSYSPQTNFDEVMSRRKKKRRGFIWWTTRSSVLLLIGFGSAYSYFNSFNQTPSTNPNVVSSHTVSTKDVSTKDVSVKDLSGKNGLNNDGSLKPLTSSNASGNRLNTSTNLSKKSKSLVSKPRGSKVQSPKAFVTAPMSQNIETQASETTTSIHTETLQEVQQRIAQIFNGKNRLSRMNISTWKTIPSDIDWIDLDLKEPEIKLRPGKLPWFVEFSAITGSNTQIDFDNQQNLSILGTQYIAQYQGSILREFQNATMWGLGISYTEWVGNGQWRNIEETITKTYDSTVMDSVSKSTLNTTTGMINYRIDKISVPLQFRFHTQILKLPIRLGAHLAPGMTTLTEGNYFNETRFGPINRQRNFSFDGKLTIGPMIPISDQFTIIIEPSLVFQTFRGPNNQWNAKSFTGLGIGMMWKVF
jgi:hypothetical protein